MENVYKFSKHNILVNILRYNFIHVEVNLILTDTVALVTTHCIYTYKTGPF